MAWWMIWAGLLAIWATVRTLWGAMVGLGILVLIVLSVLVWAGARIVGIRMGLIEDELNEGGR